MTSNPGSNSPPTEHSTSGSSPVKPESLTLASHNNNLNASEDTGFMGNDSKTARIGLGIKTTNAAALNLPNPNHQGWKCIGSRVKLTGRPPLVYHHQQQQSTQPGNSPAQTVGSASSVEAHNYNQRSFPMPQFSSNVKNTVVDYVDGDYEDPFQLESFDSLIKTHQERGKDFILARVITAAGQPASNSAEASELEKLDGDQQLFHNYYSAHQINRVLFRTQPEEGLLHRMKAKNPMNNLTIVGDVHYYRVLANQNSNASQPTKLMCAKCDKQLSVCGSFVQQDMDISGQLQPLNTSDPINKSSVVASNDAKKQNQATISEGENYFKRPPTPPPESDELSSTSPDDDEVVDICECYRDAGANQDSASGSPRPFYELIVAEYLATDDDFLMRRHIRQYFKQQALQPEDVFLFTLFGQQKRQQQQQQQSGTLAAVFGLVGQAAPADNAIASSNAPLVSDPTNPNAVAMPLDVAIMSFEQQQTLAPSSTGRTGTNTPAEDPQSTAQSQQTASSIGNSGRTFTSTLNQPTGGHVPNGLIQRILSGLNITHSDSSSGRLFSRTNSGNTASFLGRRRGWWRQRRQQPAALQLTNNQPSNGASQSPRVIDPNSTDTPALNIETNGRDEPSFGNNDNNASSPSNLIGIGSQDARMDNPHTRQRQANVVHSHQNQDDYLTDVQTVPEALPTASSNNSNRQPSQGFVVMVMAMTILTGIALIIRLTWT